MKLVRTVNLYDSNPSLSYAPKLIFYMELPVNAKVNVDQGDKYA